AGLLVRMRDAIIHRGPDEEGIWLSEDHHVGLGTRRLKIIDLVGGQQPMANEDGTLVLAYNGEVYNHRALREELEQAGRRFRTKCDTEVVLAAYEAYGDDCLERLDGMFAFAIWDQRGRRLFFARERAGTRCRALRALPRVRRGANDERRPNRRLPERRHRLIRQRRLHVAPQSRPATHVFRRLCRRT